MPRRRRHGRDGLLIHRCNDEKTKGPPRGGPFCSGGRAGGTVLAGSPAEFGKLFADETEKWGRVIRAANIKAD